jgi:hypothetical protein
MSSTHFGVVVSTGNAIIRHYVYPDHDSELDAAHHLSPGETMIKIPRGHKNREEFDAAISAAIQSTLNKPVGNPRCCMIDKTNTVVGHIHADPDLDKLPDMTIVAAYVDNIPVGSTYDPATGLFTSPQITYPVSVKNPKGLVIPPAIISKP